MAAMPQAKAKDKGFWDKWAAPIGIAGGAGLAGTGYGLGTGDWSWLTGTEAKSEPFSTLNPAQEGFQSNFLQQLSQSSPQMFKFLQQFMGDDEESFNQFAAPYLRHFQTNIVPSITERFSGGGASGRGDSGGSSGLFNALGEAGSGLEQGLASARQDQGLKASQQMQGLYNTALSPTRGTRETPGQPGIIGDIMKAIAALAAG